MSVVSGVVMLSQAIRSVVTKMHKVMVAMVTRRILRIEEEQVAVEEQRSRLMVACHNSFYNTEAKLEAARAAAIAAINARFDAKQDKLEQGFKLNKASIALVSQAASDDLKRELAILSEELERLTK